MVFKRFPNLDTDSDGTTDGFDLDDDGDGLPDSVEVELGLDPRDPGDAYGDLDADGRSNLQEYYAGTDPSRPDGRPPGIPGLITPVPAQPISPTSSEPAR